MPIYVKGGGPGGGSGSTTLSGFTLYGPNTTQAGAYVFNNCTFLTRDGSNPTVNVTGTVAASTSGATMPFAGTTTSFTLNSNGEVAEATLNGSTASAICNAQGVAGAAGFAFLTTTQTAPITGCAMTVGDDNTSNPASLAAITANSATSFTLTSVSATASQGSQVGVNVASATSVDVSAFLGNTISTADVWTLNAGAETTAVVVASSISINGGTDTWNLGRSDSVDGSLAGYANGGGTSGNLIYEGANATLGTLDPNYQTIVGNGVLVSGIS